MSNPTTGQPRPKWITVFGIFLILFGAGGIFQGGTTVATPWMVDMQKGMFGHMQRMIEQDAARVTREGEATDASRRADEAARAAEVFAEMNKRLDVPDWYRQWSLPLGLVSLVVGAIYLLAGILFLMVKRNADRLVLVALALSVSWGLVLTVISFRSESMFMHGMLPTRLFGIAVDIVFIVVMLASDRSAFREGSG